MTGSRVWTEIDFEKNGKQIGTLNLPYQTNRSAYGNICTPICVIKNGEGPTLLLTAGVHGDEYEGQVALRKLIRNVEASDINGRLIILPSLNLAASKAGTRLSPLDGMNLHGAFPGSADATSPTPEFAYYIEKHIMPMANYMVDCHAGGTSLNYMPFSSLRLTNNEDLDKKAYKLLEAFGAPLSLIWKTKNGRMLSSAAERNNVVAIAGEFGGCGGLSFEALKIVENGLQNVMNEIGILNGSIRPPSIKTAFFEVSSRDYYVHAKGPGLFEPFVALGEKVKAGQKCGQMHAIEDINAPPVTYRFQRPGVVICLRHPVLAETGDCLVHLATPVQGAKPKQARPR